MMLVRPYGAPEQVFEWEIPEDKVVSQETLTHQRRDGR